MNRERIAWLVSLVLIAMLAFQIPGTLARRDDDDAFVKTLIDIHRQIDANYVDPIDEDKLKLGSINGMMGELDPYSIYVPPARQKEFDSLLEGSFEGIGVELSQLENGDIQVVSPIEDSPALRAGVLAGDIIERVNGTDIKGKKIADVQKLIKGPLHSDVHLTVRHPDGHEAAINTTREQIVIPTVKGYRRDATGAWDFWVSREPKIGYLRITQFTSDTYKTLRPYVEHLLSDGMRGLILDLRFNPGGRLDQAREVVNLFVRTPNAVIVMTRGAHRAEEISRANPAESIQQDFPLIVLVNEHSASAAEIVAGSLMDNQRALIVGTRTYGKGSVQELIPMEEDGGELKLTVAYYYLPSGRLVHRKKGATDWGVDPQINVPMSEEAEQRVLQDQSDQELFRRPLPLTTRPTTGPAASQPSTQPAATQPIDTQLQAATSTMIGSIILNGEHQLVPTTVPATTAPAVAATRAAPPATQPAQSQTSQPGQR